MKNNKLPTGLTDFRGERESKRSLSGVFGRRRADKKDLQSGEKGLVMEERGKEGKGGLAKASGS